MAGQMTYTDPIMGVQNCSNLCPGSPRACKSYCPGYALPGIDLSTTDGETTTVTEKSMRLTTFLSHGSETEKHVRTTISALLQGSGESPLIQKILYSIGVAAVVLLIFLVIWCLKDSIERSIGRLRQWFCELTLQRPIQEMNQVPKWNQMEPEVQNLLHNSSQPKDNGKKLNVVKLMEVSTPPLDIAGESNSQTNSF